MKAKMLKKTVFTCVLVAILAGCNNHTQQPYTYAQPQVIAPAPVVVQQSSDNGVLTGALIGGAVGYMAGKVANTQSSYHVPQVVNHNTTIIQKNVVVNKPRPTYTSIPVPVQRLSLSKTTTTSSSFGGFSRRK